MRRIVCTDDKSDPIAQNITGEYRLKNRDSGPLFYGRQMPDGRLFVPFVGYVEMYEPGEYMFVYPYPRDYNKEEDNRA